MKKTYHMKRSRTYSIVLALAVVLTGMLCISAYLQYKWLNQLSVAEEVRIRSSVENAAHQLASQVNQEMMSALFTFVVPAPGSRQELAERLSERWVEWSATSRNAALVQNVYWLEYEETGEEHLYLYNSANGMLERVPNWVPSGGAYPTLDTFFESDIVSPVPFSRRGLDAVPVIPFESAMRKMQDHLFIVFDMAFISSTWIPDLVHQFFQNYQQGEYDILITAREGSDQVVYASNLGIKIHEDADVQLNIGPPDSQYVLRFLTRLMARPPLPPRGFPGVPRADQRELRAGMASIRIWRLYITHKSGALETAVSNMRRRNLGISFLVLIVLGISVGLILVYTRRIQKLANQQMAFVAGVSHDIKTPIAVMHAVGENLRDGLVSEPEETREYGMFIVDQSRSLLDTASQVLSYAGITVGSNQYDSNQIDMNRVIQHTLGQVEVHLRDVEIDVDLEATLPLIQGDAEALASVVQNLVQNAIKYSKEKPYVGLSTYQSAGNVHLKVVDTGCGILPEDQPHIFEPFYRSAEVRASQIRGNGLGLSIVKSIVEAHKGSITFQSLPEQGTTFHVTLPSYQSTNNVRS